MLRFYLAQTWDYCNLLFEFKSSCFLQLAFSWRLLLFSYTPILRVGYCIAYYSMTSQLHFDGFHFLTVQIFILCIVWVHVYLFSLVSNLLLFTSLRNFLFTNRFCYFKKCLFCIHLRYTMHPQSMSTHHVGLTVSTARSAYLEKVHYSSLPMSISSLG